MTRRYEVGDQIKVTPRSQHDISGFWTIDGFHQSPTRNWIADLIATGGTLRGVVILNPERSAAARDGYMVELIEAAPTDTSGGAVTAPTPAPSDDNTHTLDRIPGEPNPLDPYPLYGFTTTTELVDGLDVQTPPRVWITAEHFRDLGEPQQITVTITAGAR